MNILKINNLKINNGINIMNILGHKFKFLMRSPADISSDYVCVKCNCHINIQDEEYGGGLYMWIPNKNTLRHHFGRLISCDECIIKNIIE